MKKVILSSLAVLTLTTAATAGEATPVFSHVDKLKFSGLTYIGFTQNEYKDTAANPNESNFEIRRAYFQAKAYLMEDPKSYYRVTFDMHQNKEDDMVVRAKYAYLYLDNVLPATGVEIGLAHRPWHDYEEHNAWYYRDISKVLIEAKNGGDLSNSADFGVNFKTKTEFFDSEIGIFNGEGYHNDQNDDDGALADNVGTGMSFEWRATAHIMGVNGKDKQTEKTYLDASFFGQYNVKHKGVDTDADKINDRYDDLVFYGLHTVYNQPEVLLSAQYVVSEDTAKDSSYISKEAGSGYSVNGEYRFGNKYEYRAIARYDSWTPEVATGATEYERTSLIAGGVWQQNHNVQWVANVIIKDNKDDKYATKKPEQANSTAYMLTAQVEF